VSKKFPKVQRTRYCIFSAVVNGRRRYAALALQKKYCDLDTAENTLMNTRRAYEKFYEGATYDDYEATLLDRRLQVQRFPKVIHETKKGRKAA
jgi:hypothetical protein